MVALLAMAHEEACEAEFAGLIADELAPAAGPGGFIKKPS